MSRRQLLCGFFLWAFMLVPCDGQVYSQVIVQNPTQQNQSVGPSECPPRLESLSVLTASMRPAEMPVLDQPSSGEIIQTPGLTLVQLEQIALERNPALCQAAMRIQAARGEYLQVGLYPNPMAGYMSDDVGAMGTAGKQGFFLSQEIVTAGKLRLNRNTAAFEIQQAESAWHAQRLRVLNDVRAAFYDVLYARQTVAIDEQLVGIGEENVKTTEKMYTAKEVSLVDVLQARVEADVARLSLVTARNKNDAVWRQLTSVIAMPEMAPAELAGRLEDGLPQLDWHAMLQRILCESPQLAEAHAKLSRTRSDVARQYAGRIPNVDIRAGVKYDNVVGENMAQVEMGLPLPIFNRNQGNITKAEAEFVAAQNEVRRVELDLRQRLAAIFEQYENARQQSQKYAEEILPNSAKSLELVRSGYRLGEFNYQALLISQRTYFQANLMYLENLRQLRLSAVAIEGLLLSGGLQSAM
jgi:outer membrane protein, heavy metal efflux system